MYNKYKKEALARQKFYRRNKQIKDFVKKFYLEIVRNDWWRNFFWLGVPMVQAPMDLQGFAEIIWEVKPDLIIETGIKWGGSLLWNASQLAILEACGVIDKGDVIGIDITLSKCQELYDHPLYKKITMLEGSSIDPSIIKKVKELAKGKKSILIFLDSRHSHSHVLAELKAYSKLVTLGSYIIVEDTGVQDLPNVKTRQWGYNNNPRTAVWAFMKTNDEFKIDRVIQSKVLYTAYPDGYLKRIK